MKRIFALSLLMTLTLSLMLSACSDMGDSGLTDFDGDGIADESDSCPEIPNSLQTDTDGDGIGDECDSTPGVSASADRDNDGFTDLNDNCPAIYNHDQTDADEDGVGDACDNCISVPNRDQVDSNSDGIGDLCTTAIIDRDSDGIADSTDNCPIDPNTDQLDSDGDTVGDLCDNCPQTPNFSQVDSNYDGTGNACESATAPLDKVIPVEPEQCHDGIDLSIAASDEFNHTSNLGSVTSSALTCETTKPCVITVATPQGGTGLYKFSSTTPAILTYDVAGKKFTSNQNLTVGRHQISFKLTDTGCGTTHNHTVTKVIVIDVVENAALPKPYDAQPISIVGSICYLNQPCSIKLAVKKTVGCSINWEITGTDVGAAGSGKTLTWAGITGDEKTLQGTFTAPAAVGDHAFSAKIALSSATDSRCAVSPGTEKEFTITVEAAPPALMPESCGGVEIPIEFPAGESTANIIPDGAQLTAIKALRINPTEELTHALITVGIGDLPNAATNASASIEFCPIIGRTFLGDDGKYHAATIEGVDILRNFRIHLRPEAGAEDDALLLSSVQIYYETPEDETSHVAYLNPCVDRWILVGGTKKFSDRDTAICAQMSTGADGTAMKVMLEFNGNNPSPNTSGGNYTLPGGLGPWMGVRQIAGIAGEDKFNLKLDMEWGKWSSTQDDHLDFAPNAKSSYGGSTYNSPIFRDDDPPAVRVLYNPYPPVKYTTDATGKKVCVKDPATNLCQKVLDDGWDFAGGKVTVFNPARFEKEDSAKNDTMYGIDIPAHRFNGTTETFNGDGLTLNKCDWDLNLTEILWSGIVF